MKINKEKVETIPDNVDAFNTALHQYLEIEEEVKVLLSAIKQRNQKKKELGLSLSSYLRENKIKNVNLGGTYQGKKLVSYHQQLLLDLIKYQLQMLYIMNLKMMRKYLLKLWRLLVKNQ